MAHLARKSASPCGTPAPAKAGVPKAYTALAHYFFVQPGLITGRSAIATQCIK